ncbi:MAG: squalene/phytoene synthase family protein, partial [Roseomonas sp.]|nr:squalene/phytoene synthase family protein [Roseomonas sp.]
MIVDGTAVAAGPPTRDENSENFPVASRLIPAAQRPKVLAFYRFVRTADDIADHATLNSTEKLARLEAMELLLDDPAGPLAEVGTDEARLMLSAFRQDAVRPRYPDWAALEDYCARSADPVGRMLLRLHGEDDALARHASDGLCTALQILNHLQDLVPDRQAMDRIYLPVPWMALAGGEE